MAFERLDTPEEIDPLLGLARRELDLAIQAGRPIDGNLTEEIAALLYEKYLEDNPQRRPLTSGEFWGTLTDDQKKPFLDIVEKARG